MARTARRAASFALWCAAMDVTVAALQTALTDDTAANVARVTELCRQAAGRGAQIILPSELFEGHYFCRTQRACLRPVMLASAAWASANEAR